MSDRPMSSQLGSEYDAWCEEVASKGCVRCGGDLVEFGFAVSDEDPNRGVCAENRDCHQVGVSRETPTEPCAFCDILAGNSPATIIREWTDAIAFLPHNPVRVDEHFLVIPRLHVKDALADPGTAGMVMARTAELARDLGWTDANLAFNVGEFGGQTVAHVHGHGNRATEEHRNTMPWFGQQLRAGREFFLGPDGHGDEHLWTGDKASPVPVAAKHQLDDMDPLLWELVTTVLAPTDLDGDSQ